MTGPGMPVNPTPAPAGRHRTVIVMPVGPHEDPADYRDTLHSIAAYAQPGTSVLLLDDTARPDLRRSVADTGVQVDVLTGPGRSGLRGALATLVCRGLAHAVGPMGAGQVLRMDSDAVMIGPGLEAAARQAFAADPGIGALGSFRTGPTGLARDFGPAAGLLEDDLGRRGLRHPTWALSLRRLLRTAERHGYERGEHALGAALLLSRPVLVECARRGWISAAGGPAGSGAAAMGDDHLLGLLVRAAGFRTADFGRPGEPLAVSWRGLPARPEELMASNAKVVHSVKGWGDQRESHVRAVLRDGRPGPSGSA